MDATAAYRTGCPRCGTPALSDALYCSACGGRLEAASAPDDRAAASDGFWDEVFTLDETPDQEASLRAEIEELKVRLRAQTPPYDSEMLAALSHKYVLLFELTGDERHRAAARKYADASGHGVGAAPVPGDADRAHAAAPPEAAETRAGCPSCAAPSDADSLYCAVCGARLDDRAARADAPAVDTAAAPGSARTLLANPIAVRRGDDWQETYRDVETLRTVILGGRVKRDDEARAVVVTKKGEHVGKWRPLEKVARRHFRLDVLYRPVWAHTMRGLQLAWIVGFVLKALDSTLLYMAAGAGGIALAWFLFAGLTAVSFVCAYSRSGGSGHSAALQKVERSSATAAMIIGIGAILATGANLWMGALGAGLIALLLAGPLGMAAGTAVGHARRDDFPSAPDAAPEGSRPYVLGLVAPLLFAVVFIPVHFLVINPAIMEWMAS